MRCFKVSIASASCVLTLSGGVAFAEDFHNFAPTKYAGNPGNPVTNPKAVAQYDNACAQAALHAQMP